MSKYSLEVQHPDGPNGAETVKSIVSGWLKLRYSEKYPGLSERVEGDAIQQPDLFMLNEFLPRMFVMGKCGYMFKKVS